jgi:hypothetical protein
MKLELSGQIFKKILAYQISRQSHRWEPSCSMPTEAEVTKLTVAFRNFAKSDTAYGVKFICKGRGKAIPVQALRVSGG